MSAASVYVPQNAREAFDRQDHSACGVNFVAAEDGVASNKIVKYGLEGASNMVHRGGIAADARRDGDELKVTSDGAGITIQIDKDYFFKKFTRRFPAKTLYVNGVGTEQTKRKIAVGNIFFPRDNDENKDRCEQIFKEEVKKLGYKLAWREPPMGDRNLAEIASNTHPDIKQVSVLQPEGVNNKKFDSDLYLIRRRIEKRIREEKLSGEGQNQFYICSLSRHYITYKGLTTGDKLSDLYADLKDSNYKTAFAIIHDRFSTNTLPTWHRAHPYHSGVAHNGEINSLVTNVEMFKQRLENVLLQFFPPEHRDDLKDVIDLSGTDSAMLADVVDFMTHAGFSPPAIKAMLVPEAIFPGSEMSEDTRNMYAFIDTMLGPWDGPNAMIMLGNEEIMIGGDRSGFRPIRIIRTKDKIVVAGSEDGIIHSIPNKDVIERISPEPGENYAVNFKKGGFIRDPEIEARAAAELEEKFGYNALLKNLIHIDAVPAATGDYKWSKPEDEEKLLLRQRRGVMGQETLNTIEAMAATGKEPLGSMGDDGALTVVPTGVYRTMDNYFQQRFAQVTNPPLDTIREKDVTSLKTYLGYFFDKDGNKLPNQKVFSLDSPLLTNAEFKAMRKKLGEPNIRAIDCTFDARGNDDQLLTVLEEACITAVNAAKHGRHIVLTDRKIGKSRVSIPMELVVGAINTRLADKGLRGQTTIHVRSAEGHKPHQLALLTGLGADTVNFYMAEETIAANFKRWSHFFADETSSYYAETPLRQFFGVYTQNMDGSIDAEKSKKLGEILNRPAIKALLETHGTTTLEELARLKDKNDRALFMDTMKELGVAVHNKKSLEHQIKNFKIGLNNGLLKIMGKRGISHIGSYRGGCQFECVGLSQEIIDLIAPGVPTPIKGLSLTQLQHLIVENHNQVYATKPNAPLKHTGRYKVRNGEGTEPHILRAEDIERFQDAVKERDFDAGYAKYKKYEKPLSEHRQKNHFRVRNWVNFNSNNPSIDICEVESRDDIIKRFNTGSMSRGSISQEAHETLAIAANRKGFTSSNGEGGEDPARYGTEKKSKSKQVASGRFGVTLDYLLDADEIQIKMAQGAKPGEGGELPGKKVTVEIAALRHCEPGTTLISPSTHHDLYSIEDLEQLIYDIKQVNSKATVNVKLVATMGVDVIASGCAKANADSVLVSGFDGGTGASPQGSIPHAGMPWELALNKTHRTLIDQGFRDRIRLQTDGGMFTGRDVVIAAILGAEDFGYGIQALIAEGCKVMRICQSGNCAFKIAGDKGEFAGEPYMVENMMDFIAEDVREILAELGYKSLDEIRGRTDLLEQNWGQKLGLDLSDIIPSTPDAQAGKTKSRPKTARNERLNPKDPDGLTLDQKILAEHEEGMKHAIREKGTYTIAADITNEDRSFGARTAGTLRQWIIKEFGRAASLPDDSLTFNLKGSAGQSIGFAGMKGITFNLEGVANDGVGKSLSGAKIVLRPDQESCIAHNTHKNVIMGNAGLYGATSGELYAAGKTGSRFAIRNSGATAVVEGAGYAACNYMTGGSVAILGNVGKNFASGMSGGEVFVYDESGKLKKNTYKDSKDKITELPWHKKEQLRTMITNHWNATASPRARAILDDFDNAAQKFKYIDGKDKAQSVPANDPPPPPANELRAA